MTAKRTKLLWDKCSTNAILNYYLELHSVNVRTGLQLMRPGSICWAEIPLGIESQSEKMPTTTLTHCWRTSALYGHTQPTDASVTAVSLTPGACIWSYSFSSNIAPFQKEISSIVTASFSWFPSCDFILITAEWPVVPICPECGTVNTKIKIEHGASCSPQLVTK